MTKKGPCSHLSLGSGRARVIACVCRPAHINTQQVGRHLTTISLQPTCYHVTRPAHTRHSPCRVPPRQLQDAEAYRARVTADAEGEADRFVQILMEYEKAPEVTRQRIYLDTMEQVLGNSTKVLLDSENGGNMIYLPLDRLMERRGNQQQLLAPSTVPVTGVGSSAQVRESR